MNIQLSFFFIYIWFNPFIQTISGTLRDWWANSTSEEYTKRAQGIIDQYGSYTVKQVDMKVNGVNTQGENIADNGGLKAAYGGYRK